MTPTSTTNDLALDYYDIVLAGLPGPARETRRTRMASSSVEGFISDELNTLVRESKAEGRAEGRAEGKAEARAESVLVVLETRGIAVPAPIRSEILACTSLATLSVYLCRAVTAATAAEVVAPITTPDTSSQS